MRWAVGLSALLLAACVSEGPGLELTRFKEPDHAERQTEIARIRTQLALEYMRTQNYRAANAAAAEAVRAKPDYSDAWLVKAQIHAFLQQKAQADDSFQAALRLQPDSAEINNNYGWFVCNDLKQPQNAQAYFDTALADPTYPTPEIAYTNKGICATRAHDFERADAYFERALSYRADFAFAWKERARLHLLRQRTDTAQAYFARYRALAGALSADDAALGNEIARLAANAG